MAAPWWWSGPVDAAGSYSALVAETSSWRRGGGAEMSSRAGVRVPPRLVSAHPCWRLDIRPTGFLFFFYFFYFCFCFCFCFYFCFYLLYSGFGGHGSSSRPVSRFPSGSNSPALGFRDRTSGAIQPALLSRIHMHPSICALRRTRCTAPSPPRPPRPERPNSHAVSTLKGGPRFDHHHRAAPAFLSSPLIDMYVEHIHTDMISRYVSM